MSSPGNIGIVYNPSTPRAKLLAQQLADKLGLGDSSWVLPTAEMEGQGLSPLTSLIITVGGDGTILRAAQLAAPRGIPILGINLGRVGFMTELGADESLTRIGEYLNGHVRLEERTMLHARVISKNGEEKEELPLHALNDLAVGRRAISRLVHLEARVDGALVATYRADAIIVATATGSTGYALSAGGPILHPQSRDMLLKPVSPHLGLAAALVLAPDSVVEITLRSDYPAAFSLDGRPDLDLDPGETVEVKRSPYTTRFLRANPPSHFYSTLARRLNPDAAHPDPRTTPLT